MTGRRIASRRPRSFTGSSLCCLFCLNRSPPSNLEFLISKYRKALHYPSLLLSYILQHGNTTELYCPPGSPQNQPCTRVTNLESAIHPSENDNNYNQLLKELTTFQTSVDSLSALLPLIKMNLDDNLPTPLTWYSSICTGLTQQIQDVEKSSESLDWSALKCNGRTIPEMIKAMRDPHNTVDLLVTASPAIMIPVTSEEKAPIL